MADRVFNFEESEKFQSRIQKSRAELIASKSKKFDEQAVKLAIDEKRWLRKKRLANTKLRNISAAKRRLRNRRKAFEKETKQ